MAKWKKFLIEVVAPVGILTAMSIGGIAYLFSGTCGSYPYKSIASPNGKYKAVIYQFDCGATTGFSTQISILKANEQPEAEAGNIFSSDGHPKEVAPEVIWVSDKDLNIHIRAGVRVHNQDEAWGWPWGKINITYN
jgi:hypothetical protein